MSKSNCGSLSISVSIAGSSNPELVGILLLLIGEQRRVIQVSAQDGVCC